MNTTLSEAGVEAALLPCPLCGKQPQVRDFIATGSANYVQIECWHFGGDPDADECTSSVTVSADTMALAVEAWNRRAAAVGVSPPAWLVSEPPTAAGAGEAVEAQPSDIAWEIANQCWLSTTEKAALARRIRAALAAPHADEAREAALREAVHEVEIALNTALGIVESGRGNAGTQERIAAYQNSIGRIRSLSSTERQ